MIMKRSQAEALIQSALSIAKHAETTVRLRWTQTGNSRFANNEPTTNGDVERLEIEVISTVEGRSASVTGNAEEPAALRELVQEAETLARFAPVDPEHMPPLGRQSYEKVMGLDRVTAKMNASDRVRVLSEAMKVSKARGVLGSGYLEHSASVLALGNRAGMFAYYPHTAISMSMTCRSQDGTGSGRAANVGHRIRDIDGQLLAQRSSEKAEQSRKPTRMDPGRYRVLLEAQAVADLLSFFYRSLSARPADEGRSFFSAADGANRIGEKLFSDKINLSSSLNDRSAPTIPFSEEGEALHSVRWINKGVLENLSYSRFWARKQGEKTLHRPGSVRLDGENLSKLQLLAKVERGILVTRFWYNRMLEPRSITVTGLTRDGTFIIEGGKVGHSIKNFRYNDSPLNLLKNVVALGIPERVEGRTTMIVPPIVVEGFNFSSLSDAV